ncbi:MAG TPA: GIY-YIG nuclease family protein, partial [Jiangellaceae bacterium]|nr:GIY-YIG nuclease family protein [Jiangellaceae bacterium]
MNEPSIGYDWCNTCLLRGADDPIVVYRYLDAAGVPVYVGCTINPLQRLLEHQRRGWWRHVRSYQSECFVDRDAALDREAELIRLYRPR